MKDSKDVHTLVAVIFAVLALLGLGLLLYWIGSGVIFLSDKIDTIDRVEARVTRLESTIERITTTLDTTVSWGPITRIGQ